MDRSSTMMTQSQSQAAGELEQYLESAQDGQGHSLRVPEGAFKGWVPRALYSYSLNTLHLPFLRLVSFPVGGTALGCLTSMKTFHAVGNYLYRLPTSFVECSFIVSLDLSFNHFTEIPQPVFCLVNLEELNFAHNDIEMVHNDIGELVNLRYLNLAGNTLDSFPENIARCDKINKLDLSGKFYPRGKMKDFPAGVCSLHDLTELDLSWQQIERIPDEFGNLIFLQKLNLKGNRLMHVSQELSKCAKLHIVNLAGALRLCSQIPAALFGLEDLQSLNLSDNFFTEIPEEVLGLSHLISLNMQRNALLRLPDNLFQLQNLSHLEFSENYLETLPGLVGNLSNLTYLGLDRNRLTEIPEELCNASSLVTLALGSNQLASIPENIHQLSQLQDLMLENNKMTELPFLLDRLEGLLESGGLSLHGNSLRLPPQQICDEGVVPLFHFLKELRVSEAHHRRKMILIGTVKAGKTSLRNALMLGRSKLTAEHERTWVLERHLWEPESMTRVQILDFGGHHIYQAAHHMFLTPEALHLLVFDISCFRSELYDEFISNWLDAIMDRAPGATILLVGTHADLCTEEQIAERCQEIVQRIKEEETAKLNELQDEIGRCRALLDRPEKKKEGGGGRFADLGEQRMQEKLNYLEKMLNTRSNVPDMVHVVSCAEGLAGVNELKEALLTSIKSAEARKLPYSWYRLLTEIQSKPDHILSMEQASNIFTDVRESVKESSMGMGGSADRTLHIVLKYLHCTGEIVWYHDNPRLDKIVFHRPDTLIEMLRSVFRHDFNKVVSYDQALGNKVGLTSQRFEVLKKDFVCRGYMAYELLHFTLLQFQLSADALDIFVSLMLKFDLCYEVEKDSDPSRVGSTRILQFPWFFPEEQPSSLAQTWPAQLPANTFELRFKVELPRKGPPYFFEKLSVRLQQHVSERHNWKHGVLARLNHSLMLVTRQRLETEDMTVITVAARGTTDLQELWMLLKQTRKEMLQLLQDWPFIQPTFSLVCSHCLLHRYDDPYHYPGEVMEMSMPRNTYVARWCRKYEEQSVPACFVYPLDIDYQDDIQKHMQAATDFLQSALDNVDGPPGLLSDVGLSFVATRLGFEWVNLMLGLGVRKETIEQMQMSHSNNAYMQILGTLRFWRDMTVNRNNSASMVGGSGHSGDDKVRQLVRVLVQDGIENYDLVAAIKDRFHVQLDG